MLAFVDVEERVPKDHPLRTIKGVTDEALERLSGGGERLRNETHRSRTDPEARLMRKGKGREARLASMGHALMENGNGLLTDFVVSRATGTAERDAVPVMLDDARQRGFIPTPWGS